MNPRRLGVFMLGLACLTFLVVWTGHILAILAAVFVTALTILLS